MEKVLCDHAQRNCKKEKESYIGGGGERREEQRHLLK